MFLYTILNPAPVNTLKVLLNSFNKLQLSSLSHTLHVSIDNDVSPCAHYAMDYQ